MNLASPNESQITLLLRRWAAGEAEAPDELLSILYEPLRNIARQRLGKEWDAASMNTTGLVHEAYLKLANSPAASVRDRHHFFAVTSRAMSNVLVDYARARNSIRGARATPECDSRAALLWRPFAKRERGLTRRFGPHCEARSSRRTRVACLPARSMMTEAAMTAQRWRETCDYFTSFLILMSMREPGV